MDWFTSLPHALQAAVIVPVGLVLLRLAISWLAGRIQSGIDSYRAGRAKASRRSAP